MSSMTLIKTSPAINEDGVPVILWKFRDENGNLWNTETPENGTEAEALEIILQAQIAQ